MLESKVSRRLKEPTAAEVCDLIYAPRLAGFADGFGYLGDVNKAHIVMLAERGLIDPPVAVALARGVLEMERVGPQAVTLDPLREDAYFNYEAHLIEKVGTDVGGRLHIGRSRNDLLATLDRLRGRDVLMDLLDALYSVRQSALDGAARHTDAIMPGYTHLQPAQPITYGFYLSGVAQALERDCKRLAATLDSMNRSPMGAAAFAGTPFAIDRARTAELLGFDGFLENTLDAVGSRDFALESMAQMTLLAVFWSRVAQDFFVWSTHEFALIDFPDSVAGTSSIMPQKKNPVVLEYLKGRTGQVLGSLVASAATIKGTNFTHTGDGNRESMRGFWESAQECQQCLTLLDLVLRTARPNLEAGLRKAAEDFSTATGLADLMVSAANLSFREAHHVVGAVVRQAMDDGLPANRIDSAMVERAARQQLGRPLGLDEQQVRQALDPVSNVSSRSLPGGPAAHAQNELIDAARLRLEQERAVHADRRQRQTQARRALQAATERLAQS
ncbi:argininosuccinate lyase [Stutzerimonas nitrititolerans]|uniref:argininosuccinate lyase n=2 Tax=Stutzerimonas nitrititolerans TaxID=2482751 RepID=UPI00289AA1AA|nr:argininosuccinate lyase [Stutzerimonas nitrititolerans]